MLFKVFFISLFLYLLLRFLLNFLFPFLRFRKKAKQEWTRIMNQQNNYNQSFGNNQDRKSTRLNSSHVAISYAVFCLKKKNTNDDIIGYITKDRGISIQRVD